MLRIQGLHLRGREVERARFPTLVVPGGTITAVVGHTSFERKAFAHAIAGLVPAANGVISIGDGLESVEIHSTSAWQRARLGLMYAPAERNVFGRLSVRENLELAMVGRQVEGRVRDVAMDAALHVSPGLRALMTQAATTLSGGERRMLSLALCVVGMVTRSPGGVAAHRNHSRRALIIDDPTVGLHGGVIKRVAQFVRDIAADDVSVLLLEENETLATQVANSVVRVDSSGSARSVSDELPNHNPTAIGPGL